MFGFQVSHGSLLTSNILDFGSCSPNFLPAHVVWTNSWKHSCTGNVGGDPSGISLCIAAAGCAGLPSHWLWLWVHASHLPMCALGSNKTSPEIACHKKLGLGEVKLDLLSNKRQIGINRMDLSLVAENLWSYLFECQKCKYWIKVEVKLKLSLVEVVCILFCMLQALWNRENVFCTAPIKWMPN